MTSSCYISSGQFKIYRYPFFLVDKALPLNRCNINSDCKIQSERDCYSLLYLFLSAGVRDKIEKGGNKEYRDLNPEISYTIGTKRDSRIKAGIGDLWLLPRYPRQQSNSYTFPFPTFPATLLFSQKSQAYKFIVSRSARLPESRGCVQDSTTRSNHRRSKSTSFLPSFLPSFLLSPTTLSSAILQGYIQHTRRDILAVTEVVLHFVCMCRVIAERLQRRRRGPARWLTEDEAKNEAERVDRIVAKKDEELEVGGISRYRVWSRHFALHSNCIFPSK